MAAADVALTRPLESGGEVVALHAAGERCVGELRCAACGYGIVSRRTLPTCPMCRGSAWEKAPWRPSSRGRER